LQISYAGGFWLALNIALKLNYWSGMQEVEISIFRYLFPVWVDKMWKTQKEGRQTNAVFLAPLILLVPTEFLRSIY